MKTIEYNALTGETTEREMTAEEIAEMEINNPTHTNEDIRQMRLQSYKDRSDNLYLAWQKYLAMEDERAEQAKKMWLDEVKKIDEEFPYNQSI